MTREDTEINGGQDIEREIRATVGVLNMGVRTTRPSAERALIAGALPRSEARADALQVVARTMERAGKGQHWGPNEADTAYAIAELLLKLRE